MVGISPFKRVLMTKRVVSISGSLANHGATVDESSRDRNALLRILKEQRVDTVALTATAPILF